ncbi:MAG TPA: DUF3168 domain-containing protein [Bosea sp. (in: a-proteobacteria)]|jgi:hypothetical protein|uniref:DUF3168 domain-containing protein n=1 Tax=Bosea sp. (in: a-proteobacteria) TaxID=1871050 RepID=UPI002DDCD5F4|nr:DUF3168 domain-containing protein [Bosea sp. (in: a-proteobacteria)]HEV2552716.1 DUF3168 domain-containing protein [Bosea sp. (in: a-proteobacteria)]
MADPALALQGAINLKLRADVAALAGRVYDRVPAGATMPYLEIGEFQTLDDGAQCLVAFEVIASLHVWSRPGAGDDTGQTTGKAIASAVHSALHEAELDLGPAWQFLEIAHSETRYLKDPDGVTSQSILSFRALVAAA